MALVLRLVFGPVADRTGRYWSLTIVGYGLTAVCVPLLWFAPRLGSAGLAFAVVMILLERLGKAVRSPSKSALLAHAAGAVGRGRGFGVHKALDQVGAFAGPLLVAAVVAAASVWAGMAVLAVPGAIAMVLLAVLCSAGAGPVGVRRVRRPAAPCDVPQPRSGWLADAVGAGLPPVFFRYALRLLADHRGAGHLRHHRLPPDRGRARAGRGGAARVRRRDGRRSPRGAGRGLRSTTAPARRSCSSCPCWSRVVPALALGARSALVLVGVAVWGFAHGVQDSTIKAAVADLVAGAPARDGVRRLRGHPGRARDRRRGRRRLALRPVAARAGGRGRRSASWWRSRCSRPPSADRPVRR